MATPQTPFMQHKMRACMIRVCPHGLGASLRGPCKERGVPLPYQGQNILRGCPHIIRGCTHPKVIIMDTTDLTSKINKW